MYFTPNKSFKICSDEGYPEFIEEVTKTFEEVSEKGLHPSFDGLLLNYRFVKVTDAKASVVFLHGLTEFLQKYYETAWYLINSGYNVFLFDQRGHGLSGREVEDRHLVHVNDFNDYARDLDSFIKGVVEPNSDGLPIHLFSHSMGGAVALLYLTSFENNISKAAFCSPMIEPRTAKLPRFMLKSFFKKQRRKEGPDKKFIYSGGWDPNPSFDKSTDMSYNRFLSNLNIRRADWHYQNSSASNAWIDESAKVRDMLLNRKVMKRLKIPVLFMLADEDRLVKTEVTLKLAKMSDKIKIVHIENSKHTIYTSSPQAIEKFWETLIDYYDME